MAISDIPTPCTRCPTLRMGVINKHANCVIGWLNLNTREEITSVDASGNNILHLAADSCTLEILKLLHDYGVEPIINHNQYTPIHTAIASTCAVQHKYDCIKFLLEIGVDPHVKNTYGATALHRVADMYSTDVQVDLIDILLQFGAHPNVLDEWDRTPLFVLVRAMCMFAPEESKPRYAAIITSLRRFGAHTLLTSKNMPDPLEYAPAHLVEFVSVHCFKPIESV